MPTKADEDIYTAGYDNGESSRDADWRFHLNEYGGIPDDVMTGTMYEICQWIDERLVELEHYK